MATKLALSESCPRLCRICTAILSRRMCTARMCGQRHGAEGNGLQRGFCRECVGKYDLCNRCWMLYPMLCPECWYQYPMLRILRRPERSA